MSTSRSYNETIIEQFRRNGGRVGGVFESSPLLLLRHVGARSGAARVNPLGYLRDSGRYVVVASDGGAPHHPAWYHNLLAHPQVTIEVGIEQVAVVAQVALGAERDRLFDRMAEHAPQLIGFQAAAVGRVIPVVVLVPALSLA